MTTTPENLLQTEQETSIARSGINRLGSAALLLANTVGFAATTFVATEGQPTPIRVITSTVASLAPAPFYIKTWREYRSGVSKTS